MSGTADREPRSPVEAWLDEEYASPSPPAQVEGILAEEWLTWWWHQIVKDMSDRTIDPEVLSIEIGAWGKAAARRDGRAA